MPDRSPHPNADSIDFLTFEDLCDIHDRALAEFGQGAPGILDEHAVRSAGGQPEAAAFGEYLHEFPAGMAAAYLYFLTHQQGFINGNKRTAVGSAFEFLARNGYRLSATSLEVYEVTVHLAGETVQRERKEGLRELSEWILQRLEPVM